MAAPIIVADFETSLSTAISAGLTTFSIAENVDDDGVTLPTGLYYFTVDNGSSSKEYLSGTLSGLNVTGVKTVSRQGIETSGALRAHRVGARVSINDFATYKKYIDSVVVSGAPPATPSVAGILKLSTVAANTSDPIAVGDNDTRIPTQTENDALVGNGGTPGTSNRYVTEQALATTLAAATPTVQVFTASGTYVPSAGMKYAVVEVLGGGGGGQGTSGSGGSGQGGNAGAYARKVLSAATIGASQTVTIGTGGSGGTNSGGTAGGATMFGALITANGGAFALNTAATATGGDINVPGAIGQSLKSTAASGGIGGSTAYGAGGGPQAANATGYGAGGAGNGNTGSSSAGGNGAGGLIIVTEYFL